MRNVTVILDDDIVDWARVWAAQHNTSVSRILNELLAEKMVREERYTAAMTEFLAVAPVRLSQSMSAGRSYPGREALHE